MTKEEIEAVIESYKRMKWWPWDCHGKAGKKARAWRGSEQGLAYEMERISREGEHRSPCNAYMYWKQEEARYQVLFLVGEWPGASGASWIRSETAGSSFCVHIYYHFTLLYFLEERLDSYLTLPRLLIRPVFCVYNTFELLSNHLTWLLQCSSAAMFKKSRL